MVLSQFTQSSVADSIPIPEPKVDQLVVREEQKKLEDFESTEEYVRHYFSDVPVLAEVARCESEFRQTDKNGKVLRGNVDPRDVGVMQISEKYHSETAKELGYNIYTIDGNMDYALYLYKKEGARPWMASAKCWSHFSEKELALK